MGDWTAMPSEVLEKTFLSLSAKECWRARRVARSWALAVRRIAQFEVVIPASSDTVVSKVKAIRRIRAPYPNVHFTLQLEKPLHPWDSAKLLCDVRNVVSVPQTSTVSQFACALARTALGSLDLEAFAAGKGWTDKLPAGV